LLFSKAKTAAGTGFNIQRFGKKLNKDMAYKRVTPDKKSGQANDAAICTTAVNKNLQPAF